MNQDREPMLSVVLAVYNEEGQIGRCLDAVVGIADEMIVVDGESTDETAALAKERGARVISAKNQANFHINKQLALAAAGGKWILQLDADEVVTPELSREIMKVIRMDSAEIAARQMPAAKRRLFDRHIAVLKKRGDILKTEGEDIAAFFIPRLNIFLGRPMKHGGVYPDGVIRLVKNGKARFPLKGVHEQIEVDGRVDWLTNDLLHYDSPTFAKYITRANRYTSLTASALKQRGVKMSFINDIKYLVLKPTLTFLNLFLRHKGYQDGFPGFVFAIFSGIHHALAYMKLGDAYREDRH